MGAELPRPSLSPKSELSVVVSCVVTLSGLCYNFGCTRRAWCFWRRQSPRRGLAEILHSPPHPPVMSSLSIDLLWQVELGGKCQRASWSPVPAGHCSFLPLQSFCRLLGDHDPGACLSRWRLNSWSSLNLTPIQNRAAQSHLNLLVRNKCLLPCSSEMWCLFVTQKT